jgi:hypothetical protein
MKMSEGAAEASYGDAQADEALPTFEADIASLQRRLARAAHDRDAWQLAGREEKYLETCCIVGALELQLDARFKEGR